MRLTSEFVVTALMRRAETAGAYATLARRGDESAGAIFVVVRGTTDQLALYGPAPAYLAIDELPDEAALTGNRLFVKVELGEESGADDVDAHLKREANFDPDFWVVEIEDKAMRSFLPVIEAD